MIKQSVTLYVVVVQGTHKYKAYVSQTTILLSIRHNLVTITCYSYGKSGELDL